MIRYRKRMATRCSKPTVIEYDFNIADLLKEQAEEEQKERAEIEARVANKDTNRARRAGAKLRKSDYTLIKGRVKYDDYGATYGGYQILKDDSIILGKDFDLSIEDVEEFIEKNTVQETRKKSVIQTDPKTGQVVARFDSISDAIRKTGIDPSKCCRGVRKTAGGFLWRVG